MERRVWFPLRSNIHYFDQVEPRFGLEDRVKQMALLADVVAFEPGALTATVSEHGMASFWMPPHDLSIEELRVRRSSPVERGTPWALTIAEESSLGVPAEGASHRTLLGGPIDEAFFAEYHTLIHDSGLAEAPWVRWYAVPVEEDTAAKRIARRRATHERHSQSCRALSTNSFLDARLKEDLYYDLARASFGSATTVVDSLHAPLLHAQAGSAPEIDRAVSTLRVWVPNFARVPWKEILALHDHDALGTFREELGKAQEVVGPLGEPDRSLALKELQVQHLGSRLRRLEPSLRRLGADFVLNVILDLVPIPGVGAILDATTGYAAYEDHRTDWTTVLLRLQEGSATLD